MKGFGTRAFVAIAPAIYLLKSSASVQKYTIYKVHSVKKGRNIENECWLLICRILLLPHFSKLSVGDIPSCLKKEESSDETCSLYIGPLRYALLRTSI